MERFVQKKPKPNKGKGNRPAWSAKHPDFLPICECVRACVCVCVCVHTQHRCVSKDAQSFAASHQCLVPVFSEGWEMRADA